MVQRSVNTATMQQAGLAVQVGMQVESRRCSTVRRHLELKAVGAEPQAAPMPMALGVNRVCTAGLKAKIHFHWRPSGDSSLSSLEAGTTPRLGIDATFHSVSVMFDSIRSSSGHAPSKMKRTQTKEAK